MYKGSDRHVEDEKRGELAARGEEKSQRKEAGVE